MKLFIIGPLIGVLFAPALLTTAIPKAVADENDRVVQRAVVYRILQSTVSLSVLTTTTPPKMQVFCAGVVLTPSEILTAAHCARGRIAAMTVTSLDGQTTTVKEVISDKEERDLITFRLVEPLVKARPLTLSTDIAPGDTVYVAGSPDGDPFVITKGIVSKIFPEEQFENCEPSDNLGTAKQQFFETDALTFFGNSGGGAWDDRGNLVGIRVRVRVWQGSCVFAGTQVLHGFVVGPLAVQDFLRGR